MKRDPTQDQFPLWAYLNQTLFSPTTRFIWNPMRFWHHYKTAQLEQCWNQDVTQQLERCWKEDLPSSAAKFGKVDNH
jgi:hypothetical protein